MKIPVWLLPEQMLPLYQAIERGMESRPSMPKAALEGAMHIYAVLHRGAEHWRPPGNGSILCLKELKLMVRSLSVMSLSLLALKDY